MSQGKEIRFSFVVDQRSAEQAKRVIRDLIADAEKLAKTLSGVGFGGAGGGGAAASMVTGSVGGPQTTQRMISGVQTAQGKQGSLAQVFLENARNMKGLANVSKDSMRLMSEGLKRAVDEQKRSLQGLDEQLANLAKRFDQVGAKQKQALSMGRNPGVVERLFDKQRGTVLGEHTEVMARRAQAAEELAKLEQMQNPPPLPSTGKGKGGGGGGFAGVGFFGGKSPMFPMRNAQGRLFSPGLVGGMVLGGVIAGANELQAQNFDFINSSSRQAQAIGTMGVATKNGDLSYVASLLRVMRDQDKRSEFKNIGNSQISAGISTGVGGAITGLLGGDPNAPGNLLRGIKMLDATQKEQLRSYVDKDISSDPDFFNKLNRVQSEAAQRVAMMRHMGMGEVGLSKALEAAGGTGQAGELASAFDIARGGGFGFAQRNKFAALRAIRSGINPGAIGSLMSFSAAGGRSSALLNGMASGMDLVASERLMQALAPSLHSGFGPLSGMALLGPMTGVGFGRGSALDTYSAGLRGQALAGMGNLLGGKADGLSAGINILTANRIVGPGGDIYKANALQELAADPAALLSAAAGEITGPMRANNITQKDAQRLLRETSSMNNRARLIKQGGTKLTPATLAVERLVDKYSGDIRAMGKAEGHGNQLLTELGAGLHNLMPQSIASATIGREYAAMAMGIGSRGRKGRGLGNAAAGSVSEQMLAGQQQASEQDYREALGNDMIKSLAQISKALKPIGDDLIRFGDVSVSAEQLTKSFVGLTGAIVDLQAQIQGKSPSEIRAALEKNKIKHEGMMETSKAAGAKPWDRDTSFKGRFGVNRK